MYRTSAAREWTALEAPVQATKMGGNDDLLKKKATTATGMGDGYVKVRKEGGKKTPGQEPKADAMTAVTSPTTRTQCPSLLPSFCSLSSLALSFDASAAPVAATAGTAPTTIKTSHFLLAPLAHRPCLHDHLCIDPLRLLLLLLLLYLLLSILLYLLLLLPSLLLPTCPCFPISTPLSPILRKNSGRPLLMMSQLPQNRGPQNRKTQQFFLFCLSSATRRKTQLHPGRKRWWRRPWLRPRQPRT